MAPSSGAIFRAEANRPSLPAGAACRWAMAARVTSSPPAVIWWMKPRWLSPTLAISTSPTARPAALQAVLQQRYRGAEAEQLGVSVIQHRLGHDAAGVGVVEDESVSATAAIVRAISIITGMVRRALNIPPGPVVSWPMTP